MAACAYEKYTAETGDRTKTVIASTASPYKFTRSVMEAIDQDRCAGMTDLELVDELSALSGTGIPKAIQAIRTAPVRHKTVCGVSAMKETVLAFLGAEQE